MAEVRELITKLTTKADTSGAKAVLAAIKRIGKETLATSKAVKENESATRYIEHNKVLYARKKLRLIREQLALDKGANRETLNDMRAHYRNEMKLLKLKGKRNSDADKSAVKSTQDTYTRKRVSAIRDSLFVKERTRMQVRQIKDSHKESMNAVRKRFREERKLRNLNRKEEAAAAKAANRENRSRTRGGGRGFNLGGGGGGIGLGSLISANVIATAITNAFRTGLQSVKDFAAGMIGAAADIEKVKAEFGVMLGSGEKALTLVAELKKKGAETPLQFKDLAKNARILLQYGSSAEEVTAQLTTIGDVVGGDAERFDFLTYAFAQTRAAGKLMGQELRQMINAGFNPLEQMMKTSGNTMDELRIQMEAGEISAEDVAQAFRDATGPGGRFFNNMAVQSKTFTGRVSTMKDEIFMMMEAMGNRLLPGMKNAVNSIIDFVKGPGRKIGINLMDAILPAVNAVIRGFERFFKVVFNLDSIGKTLSSKEALGAFFENLADKIDSAFETITLGALKLKEFFNDMKPVITEMFGLMVWGISTVIENLPSFIKLWVGFKAIGILGFMASLALQLGNISKGLLGFAIANPALAAATALLLGMGIAAKSLFDTLDRDSKLKAFNEEMKEEFAKAKALKIMMDAEKENMAEAKSDYDAVKNNPKLTREAEEASARLAESTKKYNELASRRKVYTDQIEEERAITFGNSGGGVIESITNMLKDITGIGTSSSTSSSDALLEKIRNTNVTQNFFIKTDVKTEVNNNIPEGRDDSKAIGKATGTYVRASIHKAFDEQFSKLRTATAS